ncbi:MAG: lmo0937 family membrane protein [Thermoanaerobaculia bacterium]
MLLTIGVILLVAWLLGLFAFHVSGGLIHLVLVLAVIAFIVHLITGRRGVV